MDGPSLLKTVLRLKNLGPFLQGKKIWALFLKIKTLKIFWPLGNCFIYLCHGSGLLVENLSQEIILGTPFFTQIYPFKVIELGITTKIFGEKIIFKFYLQ